MLSSLPLDTLHGDSGSFLDELKGLFPDLGGSSMVSGDMADRMHDNDFSMIIISKGKGGSEERNRFFPRHDPMHALSSLVSLLKNRDMIAPETVGNVTKKILVALPAEKANSGFVQQLLQGLGVNLQNPEAVDNIEGNDCECGCHGDSGPVEMHEDEIKPKVVIKESSAAMNYLLDSGTNKYVPIDTEEQIKTAAVYLNNDGRKCDVRVFEQMYHKLASRMIEMKIHPKTAGLEDIKVGHRAPVELMKRAEYVSKDHAKMYFEVYKNMDKFTPIKLAQVITELDELTGANKLYARGFVRTPLDTVTCNIKTAEESLVYHDVQSGNSVSEYMLEQAVKSNKIMGFVAKMLGDDVSSEMKKDPVPFFKHLPDMHKNMIAKIFKENEVGMSDAVMADQNNDCEKVVDQPARAGSIIVVEESPLPSSCN